jgi:hypothetical protein
VRGNSQLSGSDLPSPKRSFGFAQAGRDALLCSAPQDEACEMVPAASPSPSFA